MTPPRDTPPPGHRHEAALDRLRAKGNQLAPVMVDGRVRPKGSNQVAATRGAGRGRTAPQGPIGVIARPKDSEPPTGHTAPGTVFEFTIPAPCEFLNANRDKGLHWAPKAEKVRAWRAAAARAAILTGAPKGLDRVQIDAYVIKPRANRFDPANWAPTAKACVDGMVDAGITEDDDRHHVAGPFMHDGGKGEPALRVVVTVLEVKGAAA